MMSCLQSGHMLPIVRSSALRLSTRLCFGACLDCSQVRMPSDLVCQHLLRSHVQFLVLLSLCVLDGFQSSHPASVLGDNCLMPLHGFQISLVGADSVILRQPCAYPGPLKTPCPRDKCALPFWGCSPRTYSTLVRLWCILCTTFDWQPGLILYLRLSFSPNTSTVAMGRTLWPRRPFQTFVHQTLTASNLSTTGDLFWLSGQWSRQQLHWC